MAIPCGLPNELARRVSPLVLPAVHCAVPEQIPAYVVTAREVRSSFLMALLSLSAIKAYALDGCIAMALGHLKPAFVPVPSSLLAVAVPAIMLVTLEDRMTFWTRLFQQSGTKAKEASADTATWPTLVMPEPNVMVVTSLVARSIFLKFPALFSPTRANTG
jgi:hypothetical protein